MAQKLSYRPDVDGLPAANVFSILRREMATSSLARILRYSLTWCGTRVNRMAGIRRLRTNGRLLGAIGCSILTALVFAPTTITSAEEPGSNLVLVTLDGVRWQEVFGGIDASLIEDGNFTADAEYLNEHYWHDRRTERRQRLFPFLWSEIAANGVLIGDRESDSRMEVTNPWWFSYPGYNEILTGQPDPRIDSNDKNWNENVTLLEVLNGLPDYRDRVAAFASWDVFPYIVNSRRSGVPVNAGFELQPSEISERTQWLNEAALRAPKIWNTVRLDFITHGYALETMRIQRPRAVYIAYGETDDFAHDESYDRYIDAAYRTDRMLAELWAWLQSDDFYRGRTTLLITTDHGRGNRPEDWPGHGGSPDGGDSVEGSNNIWFAAIGPRIRPDGIVAGEWTQSQIAATALASIGLDESGLMPTAADPIREILEQARHE